MCPFFKNAKSTINHSTLLYRTWMILYAVLLTGQSHVVGSAAILEVDLLSWICATDKVARSTLSKKYWIFLCLKCRLQSLP